MPVTVEVIGNAFLFSVYKRSPCSKDIFSHMNTEGNKTSLNDV
jgi:hypothetical protein